MARQAIVSELEKTTPNIGKVVFRLRYLLGALCETKMGMIVVF